MEQWTCFQFAIKTVRNIYWQCYLHSSLLDSLRWDKNEREYNILVNLMGDHLFRMECVHVMYKQ